MEDSFKFLLKLRCLMTDIEQIFHFIVFFASKSEFCQNHFWKKYCQKVGQDRTKLVQNYMFCRNLVSSLGNFEHYELA